MSKRILVAGLLGGVALIAWTFVINGILGFRSDIDMKQVQDERRVYEVLKESITEPGRYVCNPEVSTEGNFPGEEPVFGISYSGMGHDAAGGRMIVGLVLFFLIPFSGAWLLSHASDRTLSSFGRKVLFFTIIGILFALYAGFNRFGIDGYPMRDAALLGLYDVAVWVIIGLVLAWRIKPVSARQEA